MKTVSQLREQLKKLPPLYLLVNIQDSFNFFSFFNLLFPQMGSANPAASNVSSSHQSNLQPGSSNQVRAGDACHQQQPPPPHRSSSLLPALRRRASEPLAHSHRQRYAQQRRPGETHTRYTYGFNQRERRSGYTFGLAQRDVEYSDDEGGYGQNDVYRPITMYEFGFVPHSQTLEGNLNRERYEYGHTHSRMLDNTHSRAVVNTQDCKPRHTRSRTLDAIHSQDTSQGNSYTENIRAMAGQMYGDPPVHSRIPTHSHTNRNTHRPPDVYVDAHSHNYAHNRGLTRQHHLRLSGGL